MKNITIRINLEVGDTADIEAIKAQIAMTISDYFMPDGPYSSGRLIHGDEGVENFTLDGRRFDRINDRLEVFPESGLTADEENLVVLGKTIQAIKSVRERTSLGLGDAKMIVDRFKQDRGIGPAYLY